MYAIAWYILISIPFVRFLMAEHEQNQGCHGTSGTWGHLGGRTQREWESKSMWPGLGFWLHLVALRFVLCGTLLPLPLGWAGFMDHEGSVRRWCTPKHQHWVSSPHQCIYTRIIHSFPTSNHFCFPSTFWCVRGQTSRKDIPPSVCVTLFSASKPPRSLSFPHPLCL